MRYILFCFLLGWGLACLWGYWLTPPHRRRHIKEALYQGWFFVLWALFWGIIYPLYLRR